MHDKPKILFCLYFVTNHAPEGIDQVEAAHECYKYAKEHEEQLTAHAKANEVVQKIFRKYKMFKVQHLLHLYGLADEKFLLLVENPEELIKSLYNHESIFDNQKIAINTVVQEICTLFNTNFEQLQVYLLERWLKVKFDQRRSLMDDTRNGHDDAGGGISDENVKRAYFILKDWEPERAIRFTAIQILDQDSDHNTGKKLQLIECFTKLLKNVGDSHYEELITQEHYNVYKCVHHLQQLGYKFDEKKFESADKLSVLKKIWSKHAQEPTGIELLCFICLAYNINEAQVWNGILTQMVKHDMIVPQLAALVHILSAKPELLHVAGLRSAWMAVIKAPFKQASRVKPTELEALLVKSLILLQSCPVSADLNLLELADICLRLEQPHLAVVLVAYAKDPQRNKIIELLKPHKSANLVKAVLELKEHGVNSSAVSFSLQLLQQ